MDTYHVMKNMGDLNVKAALLGKQTQCSGKDNVAVRSRTSLMTDSGGKRQRELGVEKALVS